MKKRTKAKMTDGVDELLLRITAIATDQGSTTLLLTLKNALVAPNAQCNVRNPPLNW